MMTEYPSFGARLRQLRLWLGWTREYFVAMRLPDIDADTLWRWERDEEQPDPMMLDALLAALTDEECAIVLPTVPPPKVAVRRFMVTLSFEAYQRLHRDAADAHRTVQQHAAYLLTALVEE